MVPTLVQMCQFGTCF